MCVQSQRGARAGILGVLAAVAAAGVARGAELELDDEAEPFVRPSWLGAEVTYDGRYFNSYLASHPWRGWPEVGSNAR